MVGKTTLYVLRIRKLASEIAQNLAINDLICQTELKILKVGVEMNLT